VSTGAGCGFGFGDSGEDGDSNEESAWSEVDDSDSYPNIFSGSRGGGCVRFGMLMHRNIVPRYVFGLGGGGRNGGCVRSMMSSAWAGVS